jgi:GDP-4-dehydro-6-deoxy-D-mannose reductase
MTLDLLDPAAVLAGIAAVRPTAVYHCAGAAHVGDSWSRTGDTLAINVLCTHHVLEALRRVGLAPRVVIPSSALVYQQSDKAIGEEGRLGPASPYALSKLAQEMTGIRAMVEDGVPVLISRSFNHVGPRQDPGFFASSFARQIALIEAGRAAPVIHVGNLAARRDLTDVRDTVRAYRLLMKSGRPGHVYNVCSGRAYPIREILDGLIACARVPIEVHVDPARYRPHDTPVLLGNPQRMRDELGWGSEIPMEQTLRDLLGYWRSVVESEPPPEPQRGPVPPGTRAT